MLPRTSAQYSTCSRRVPPAGDLGRRFAALSFASDFDHVLGGSLFYRQGFVLGIVSGRLARGGFVLRIFVSFKLGLGSTAVSRLRRFRVCVHLFVCVIQRPLFQIKYVLEVREKSHEILASLAHHI